MVKVIECSKTGSPAEDKFISLFCDVFGPKNSKYVYLQHPVVDIYGGRRYIDFALQSEDEDIAVKIDREIY